MNLGLIIDGLILVMLVVSIGYSFVLYRRLSVLREAQDEMTRVMADFTEASNRAQAAIHRLRSMSEQVGPELEGQLKKARSLADELSFLVDSGNSLADRLEKGSVDARKLSKAALPTGPMSPILSEGDGYLSQTPAPSDGLAEPLGLFEDDFDDDEPIDDFEAALENELADNDVDEELIKMLRQTR